MAKLLFVGFIAIAFVFVNISHSAIDPETLVGMWLFDGGDDAADSSGNENHGELMNGPEHVNDGKFGGALSFDGDDDYVIVPTSDSLNSCAESYTGMLWAKLTKKDNVVLGGCCNDDHAVLNFQYTCLLNVFGPGRGGNHGKAEIGSMQLNPEWVSGPTLVNDGDWHHLVFTYDGELMKVYVDGNVDAEQPTTGVFGLTGEPLKIGGMPGERPTHGLIDEVAVFNVALSEDDINNILDEGLERATGITAVSSAGKLAATWGWIRN